MHNASTEKTLKDQQSLTAEQSSTNSSNTTKERTRSPKKPSKLTESMRINPTLKQSTQQSIQQSIPLSKPPQNTFYTHKPGCTAEFAGLIDRVMGDKFLEDDFYLVSPKIQELIADSLRLWAINLSVDENDTYYLDISKLPSLNGYTNAYNETKAEIDAAADGKWVSYKTDRQKGVYVLTNVNSDKPLPTEWPDFDEELEKAFEGRIIDSLDHPLLKKLNITVPCDSLEAIDDF